MKLPNGFGSVYKLSGKNRRNPYVAKKTKGWEIDTETGKAKQLYINVYSFFVPSPEALQIKELPVFTVFSSIWAFYISSLFVTFYHVFWLPKVVKIVVNSPTNQAVSRSISSFAESYVACA